jgi:hypothetical protein
MDDLAKRLFRIYDKLGAQGRKKVDDCAAEQWELQQLRKAAAKPKEKKITVVALNEKAAESSMPL